jgi:hypothetical protein
LWPGWFTFLQLLLCLFYSLLAFTNPLSQKYTTICGTSVASRRQWLRD